MKLVQSSKHPQGIELRLLIGDLTQSNVDVIVNAANKLLQHGAGVAGAIVRRGGKIIQSESDAWIKEHGAITPAQPALTSAGKLASKAVIHVVGPQWGEGDEHRKLKRAVIAALEMANANDYKSIAFPAISTGIYGFPMDQAARIMLTAIDTYLERENDLSIEQIDIVLFDQSAAQTFQQATDSHRPGSSQ